MNKQGKDGQLADEQDRVHFFPATDFTDTDIDTLTEKVRRRVLRWMAKHGVLDAYAADDMLTWNGHGGFSLNASVHADPWDRSGLERLARYCARPPFAAGRIHQQDEQTVVYELPPGDVHGRTAVVLTPFQLIERLVRLIPPPRLHRHRYAGAFAANSPLRPHVIKSAAPDERLAQRLHHAARQMDLLDSTQPNNTEQDVPEMEDVAEQPATETATAKTTTKPNKPRRVPNLGRRRSNSVSYRAESHAEFPNGTVGPDLSPDPGQGQAPRSVQATKSRLEAASRPQTTGRSMPGHVYQAASR